MKQTFKGAGIAPPALELAPRHFATLDISIVDVGDLQLATARGFECANDFEHAWVIHVDADHGVIRLWLSRLFFDFHHALAVKLRHTEALRVGYLFEQNLCATLLL